jgi:DNA polymerase III subunit epsilon
MLSRMFQWLFGRRAIQGGSQPIVVTPAWLSRLPASVVFCDVETTGLTDADRMVSFSGIGLQTAPLANGQFELAYSHLVFDPGRKSHARAEHVHGYSDWALRFQNPFSVYAEELWRFVSSYDLFVAHNAPFDLGFVNREMVLAGLPALSKPVYCTMEGFRALGVGGSASLGAVCERIKLKRASELHGALEDAWLTMHVYLWLHGCPLRAELPPEMPLAPTNVHEVPPALARRTPLRKHYA